jgi:hypothetical protein
MTEKERIEEIREAAEAVEEKVQAKEAEVAAAGPRAHPSPRKGLMERRESFAQTSVPNAHRGYSGKPPRVMMVIIAALFVISFILAAITV